MSYSRGGSQRGGRGGGIRVEVAKPKEYNPYHDKYCANCGDIIWGQATKKFAKCPKQNCQETVRFRNNKDYVGSNLMTHCKKCDAYAHSADSYCTVCGLANTNAILMKRKRVEDEAKREGEEKDKRIKMLEEQLEKVKKENQELTNDALLRDESYMSDVAMGEVNLNDDEAFNSSPNAEKSSEQPSQEHTSATGISSSENSGSGVDNH